MKFLVTFLAVGVLSACSDASFKGESRNAVEPLPEAPPPLPDIFPEPEPIVQDADLEREEQRINPEIVAEVTEETVLTKEYGAQIPGVATVRVGVNFEDTSNLSDRDFNDAVLCFQGYFKVDQAKVISAINQTITATTSSISQCSHTVEVTISHADGTAEKPVIYNSRTSIPLSLAFKTGDGLNVTLTSLDPACDAGVKRNMSDPNFAKVLIGICNTSGR